MTFAYRIHKAKYPGNSGEGAKKLGGRWNPPGFAAIYAAAYASLAVLEILVHYTFDLPNDFSLTEIRIPNSVGIEDGWKDPFVVGMFAASNQSTASDPKLLDDNSNTQAFGRQWIQEQRSAVLAVPSAILALETNYVINPDHPDFSLLDFLAPKAIALDPRLMKR